MALEEGQLYRDGNQLNLPGIYILALHFFQRFFARAYNVPSAADSGTRLDWT